MNGKLVKEIRLTFKHLPKSVIEVDAPTIIGADLIDIAVKNMEGEVLKNFIKNIHPNKRYKNPAKKVVKALDVVQEFKKFYKKNPETAYVEFLRWFEINHDKMIKKYPQIFIKQNQ